jgi:hypothetical protein
MLTLRAALRVLQAGTKIRAQSSRWHAKNVRLVIQQRIQKHHVVRALTEKHNRSALQPSTAATTVPLERNTLTPAVRVRIAPSPSIRYGKEEMLCLFAVVVIVFVIMFSLD